MATVSEARRPEPDRRPAPALVSVVIPARNAAAHIADQLAALAAQTYHGKWELVIVDDGSVDETVAIIERWRGRLPALQVVPTHRRAGLNHARNTGARAARGELLAFCDADDVVVPDWLGALVKTAVEADLVGGALDLDTLNAPPIRAWRPAEPLAELPVAYDFLPYVPGGNCAIWADVARRVGWDESYRFGNSDREFAWRAQLGGYRLAYAAEAIVRQRYRTGALATFLQHLRYGGSAAHLYRDFRGHGMQSLGLAGARSTWRWLLRNARDLGGTPEQRGNWLRRAAVALGRLGGSLRWGAFYP